MRTTLDLDPELVQRALLETRAKSKTQVVHMGLQALLDREARKRIKALFGRGTRVARVPRRRA